MLRATLIEDAPDKREFLEQWQADIDVKPTHVERKEEAERVWKSKRQSPKFEGTIIAALANMVAPHGRCMFCEDNATAQVEHFWPRALFPRLTFEWLNFLYSCGVCNGKKADRFPIVTPTDEFEHQKKTDRESKCGRPGWINPRHENPMDFLKLDLAGKTFEFGYIHAKGTVGYLRANWTVTELGLNGRNLPIQREEAYDDYVLRLKEYAHLKHEKRSPPELAVKERGIARRGHLTVFREMQRQWQDITELRAIFEKTPEFSAATFPKLELVHHEITSTQTSKATG